MFSRVVLPLLLFVGMVAGIAWVAQNVPWRGHTRPETKVKAEPPNYLQFEQLLSRWDIKNSPFLKGSVWLKAAKGEMTASDKAALLRLFPAKFKEGEKRPDEMDDTELKALAELGLSLYVKEYETNQSGSYDFPFANATDRDVEVGLKEQSCVCSSVKVCVFDTAQAAAFEKAKGGPDESPPPGVAWRELPVSDKQGTVIPPRAKGLVRVSWKPREQKQEKVVLTVQLWSQPQGEPEARGKIAVLQTAVRFLPPVLADVPELKFRPIEAKASSVASFWCLSCTRAGAKDLRVVPDDPNIVARITKADAKQRLALQDRLWTELHGLILEAWLIDVTAYEERQGRQMDMGAFTRRLSLYVDDEKDSQPGPLIKGFVSSEVQVGTTVGANEGKIDLGLYDVRYGFHKHQRDPVKLRTEPGVVLKYLEQETFPTFFKVTLSPNAKESTKGRGLWNLQIDVPSRDEGNDYTGPLPENSAIILVREKAGAPPRRIRILVEGTAGITAVGRNPR